ncbi:hypothetical protein ALC56_09486 [Trachymyrmex septentrionalis]|uniref:CCHC-type domain-containing protein n=1 Tax=Trachymyrmex septentrionalis TaxID=34720 RepID=A0A151JUC8_9HYME|nr:hypothetical protein ALC56_09486 [Trachymyrmex septentrionalis]
MTSRLGSCWVRCPVDADKMLMAAQRITVEWSSCKMALLPAHGLQCYKYLEAGNVQSKCTSPVDRSGCCYRCGAVDHKAKECCSVRLDCPACGTLCWLSSHCIVGPGCTAPGKKMKKGAKPSGPPAKAADRRDLVRARFAPFNRRSEKERMHTNLSLRNLDMVEYAQLLITITHYHHIIVTLITMTPSADTLRDIQISRCKIPKRPDTPILQHGTSTRYDTKNVTRVKSLE